MQDAYSKAEEEVPVVVAKYLNSVLGVALSALYVYPFFFALDLTMAWKSCMCSLPLFWFRLPIFSTDSPGFCYFGSKDWS